MWTTPEKHTKKRETLGNANQNKTTRTAGYNVLEKTQRKHSELKEPYEMLHKTKTLTNIADIRRPKKKPENEPVKLERSPTETTRRRTEPTKC